MLDRFEITEEELASLETGRDTNIQLVEGWCGCSNSYSGAFMRDGECSCGIHKHHFHCGNCGDVTQVG